MKEIFEKMIDAQLAEIMKHFTANVEKQLMYQQLNKGNKNKISKPKRRM